MSQKRVRGHGISALAVFFLFGALASGVAAASLLFPGKLVDAIWRLNPRAHERLIQLGLRASVLFFVVSVCCALAGIGLWRGRRWGYWLAITLIVINLIADIANALTGTEPRAIIGVPIAAAVILYLLSRRVRKGFLR